MDWPVPLASLRLPTSFGGEPDNGDKLAPSRGFLIGLSVAVLLWAGILLWVLL
jgi:hypothetical protein